MELKENMAGKLTTLYQSPKVVAMILAICDRFIGKTIEKRGTNTPGPLFKSGKTVFLYFKQKSSTVRVEFFRVACCNWMPALTLQVQLLAKCGPKPPGEANSGRTFFQAVGIVYGLGSHFITLRRFLLNDSW